MSRNTRSVRSARTTSVLEPSVLLSDPQDPCAGVCGIFRTAPIGFTLMIVATTGSPSFQDAGIPSPALIQTYQRSSDLRPSSRQGEGAGDAGSRAGIRPHYRLGDERCLRPPSARLTGCMSPTKSTAQRRH